MTLLLILVGYVYEEEGNKHSYCIEINEHAPILSQDLLKTEFIKMGFNSDSFSFLNFFCENKNLKKGNIELVNDINKIHVFTVNTDIKSELIMLFKMNGKPMLLQDIENISIPELSLSELEIINNRTIKLLQDEDFKSLIHIYKERPELFKTFYQYISSGTIIESKNEKYSTFNFEVIKGLNLNIDDSLISTALQKTGDNLNLAIRYILFNN